MKILRISFLIFGIMMIYPVACFSQDSALLSAQRYNDGINKYNQHNYQEAVQSFRESHNLNPTAKTAYTLAYIFAVNIKNFDEAKYWAKRALNDTPPLPSRQRESAEMILKDPKERMSRSMYGKGDSDSYAFSFSTESCFPSGRVSEETSPAFCPQDFAVKGIWCSGPYCDNKNLNCCPLSIPASSGSAYWSAWFSEEPPGTSFLTGGALTGLQCSGKYCDNISVLTRPLQQHNSSQCYQTPYFSEEGEGYMECHGNFFVAGLSCQGSYCDNIALLCCPY